MISFVQYNVLTQSDSLFNDKNPVTNIGFMSSFYKGLFGDDFSLDISAINTG